MTDDTYGLCQCGCGQPTWIAGYTSAKHGYVKGQPTRFLRGHSRRGEATPWRERFVERDAGYVTPCSEWTGATDGGGYGQVRIAGRLQHVSILVWTEAHGPVPEGHEVCHHCDNPPCAREDHLFLGTHGENMADAAGKGRTAKGEAHGIARLAKAEVLEILAAEGVTQAELAVRYGVARTTIQNILNRRTWKHV